MIDLHEGRLRAWLDGELRGPEADDVATRVDGDPDVRRKVEELRRREARTEELLSVLVIPDPPVARVRAVVDAARRAEVGADGGVRGTAGRARWRQGHWWARRTRLAQAAVMVLILAGAASAALPGSPVRDWILRTLDPGSDEVAVSPATDDAPEASAEEARGITMAPDDGRIQVELVGLPPGTAIVVNLTDGDRAGVYAPRASRLEGETGRILARAEGGPIRIDLPRSLSVGDLLVDGRVYLMKRGDRLDLRVPATDSSSTEIRFRTGS